MRHHASPPTPPPLPSPSPSPSSSSSSLRRKNRITFARYALIGGAITSILLLFWISSTAVVHDYAGDLSLLHSRERNSHQILPEQEEQEEEREEEREEEVEEDRGRDDGGASGRKGSCATVEEMGAGFGGGFEKESLRVRELIRRHFEINGTSFYDLAYGFFKT